MRGHWFLQHDWFNCPECNRKVEVTHTTKCPYCEADYTKKYPNDSSISTKIGEQE